MAGFSMLKRLPSQKQKEAWKRDGYIVLRGLFSKRQTRAMRDLIDNAWRDRVAAGNPLVADIFLDTNGQRVLFKDAPANARDHVYKLNDMYLENSLVRDMALDNSLVAVLNHLVSGTVCICNSLVFERGSQQGLHVDTFYMPPPANGELIVSSICLEDVNESAGPVNYVPGSYTLAPYYNADGDRAVRTPEEQAQATHHLNGVLAEHGRTTEHFLGREGDVLIWHEQLIHGGSLITNPALTRKSLVTHYWRSEEISADQKIRWNKGFYLDRSHQSVA